MRPVCDDKNCQSAKSMYYDKKCQMKSEGTQSSHMQLVQKTSCTQNGTQPELTRNNVHAALPTHDHFVCPQALCEHSTSKSCYPSETKQMSPVSRHYKKQSNHSDSRSSKKQSPQKRSVNPGKMQSNHMWPETTEVQEVTCQHKVTSTKQANK